MFDGMWMETMSSSAKGAMPLATMLLSVVRVLVVPLGPPVSLPLLEWLGRGRREVSEKRFARLPMRPRDPRRVMWTVLVAHAVSEREV